MLKYVCQFFKIRVVFHTLYLWNEVCDLHFFFCISDTSNVLSDFSKKLKKIYQLENFRTNVLNHVKRTEAQDVKNLLAFCMLILVQFLLKTNAPCTVENFSHLIGLRKKTHTFIIKILWFYVVNLKACLKWPQAFLRRAASARDEFISLWAFPSCFLLFSVLLVKKRQNYVDNFPRFINLRQKSLL